MITIDVVDPTRRIVQAFITDGDITHRLGHLPGESWFCTTCRNKRCPHIATIRNLVTPMEVKP
ncbi:MAG: hypothetical protein GEU74_12390 [Nitriliruptorales bacterium]|nr:hypothetical protein [Nitriliruptorales bacterium]